MNILKNMHLGVNPITTILGLIFIIVSLVMFCAPLINNTTFDIKVPTGIGVLGLVLLLIPDDLKGALSKILNRKSEQI